MELCYRLIPGNNLIISFYFSYGGCILNSQKGIAVGPQTAMSLPKCLSWIIF